MNNNPSNIDPKNALSAAAEPQEDPYNYEKGWKTIRQEWPLNIEDYCRVAAAAVPELERKMVRFCERNGLSCNVLPHDSFQKDFEKGGLDFRSWYYSQCTAYGLNTDVDVLIVVSAKDPKRATEKFATQSPEAVHNNKDFLRGMFVVLDGWSPKSHRASISRLGDTINALENDRRTLAIHNLFYSPKSDNAFRAFKAAWKIQVSEDDNADLEGVPILASLKLQHETQMDDDKLTRKFLGRIRASSSALSQFWDTCTGFLSTNFKNTASNMGRVCQMSDNLSLLTRFIYDRTAEKSGFNQFLDPALIEKHKAPSDVEFQSHVKGTLHGLSGSLYNDIRDFMSRKIVSRSGQVPNLSLVK